MILDIHSHRSAPYSQGVVCIDNFDSPLLSGQLYSAGIHPWETTMEPDSQTWTQLENLVSKKEVVAIGECGVDLLKGGPLFRQLQILKRQIELSEHYAKPLVLHCVKGADILMGLKRDLAPKQPWIIHGFRGKPGLAAQLVDKGFYISFGEKFNPDTVLMMPGDRILAETDESILDITQIIESLSVAANSDLTDEIAANTGIVLGILNTVD